MKLLKLWLIFSLLTALGTSWAGNIRVETELVEFEGGRKEFKPRDPVVIKFGTSEYIYGSGRFVYLPIVVTSSSDSLGSAASGDWLVYGALSGSPSDSPDIARGAAPYTLRLRAPETPGTYKVYISGAPLFRDAPFKSSAGYKESFVPHSLDERELAHAVASHPQMLQKVTEFEVIGGELPPDETPPVYLKVNGQVPSQARFPGGIQPNPIKFSWSVGNEFRGDRESLSYRYKLEPEDEGQWGAWTTSEKAAYSFMLKGVHRFEIQAKYEKGDRVIESIPATIQFFVPKDHVSEPTAETLQKAPVGIPPVEEQDIRFNDVYAKSRALIVGVWGFEDKLFPQFDATQISKDIAEMKSALQKNGFEVSTLSGKKVTREDIAQALSDIVDAAGRDDRIFVYFSTHGFPDPVMGSEGYLATTDCEMAKPTVRCLRLNDLSQIADRAVDGKQVRQILFAVDSCFSGLGVVQKSVEVPDLTKLAVPKGAYMLTAGMANQKAEIDPELGMSTFTHFLAAGLNGDADILESNGMITLSELFVYVQYKVAQRTQAKQIPMLGRIKGSGEMLFLPARKQ